MWRGIYRGLTGLTAMGVVGFLAVYFLFEPRGDPVERAELGGEHCLEGLCIPDVSLTYCGLLVAALGCTAFLARMLALKEKEVADSRDWEWLSEEQGEALERDEH